MRPIRFPKSLDWTFIHTTPPSRVDASTQVDPVHLRYTDASTQTTPEPAPLATSVAKGTQVEAATLPPAAHTITDGTIAAERRAADAAMMRLEAGYLSIMQAVQQLRLDFNLQAMQPATMQPGAAGGRAKRSYAAAASPAPKGGDSAPAAPLAAPPRQCRRRSLAASKRDRRTFILHVTAVASAGSAMAVVHSDLQSLTGKWADGLGPSSLDQVVDANFLGARPDGTGGAARILFTVGSADVADAVVRSRCGLTSSGSSIFEAMLPGLLAANAAEGVGPTGAALALLDFRKAYDTIDRGFLIAVMEAVGVGDGVLAWTRTILTHTYASAEVNGFISAPRKYAAGVRQGCPAAPALFLFLGHALACFLRTCPAVGVEVVPGCRVTCPQYADDCMPLLRSCAPADVAALVETMAVFGRATGLVLNLGKCGILPLGSAGEGLLAGAEVAGLRVLDAGVSLGVPVSAGLPPPEGVTGVCRERLAAAYTKLARFPMSAFGRGHAAATYGVSRILFRAVHCGMTPEAERVLSRWTATLVDRSVGPDPPAELPRWASSVPAELWGAEAPLWANPLLQLELPAAQRSVQWREPTGDAAGHALFSPTDAARWLVDGLARVRDALPGMRTVTDLCVLWAWLAAVDMVFAGLRGLEAAVPTLWRMPLLNARKEPIWRLWPPARSVAVERAGELATMDLWDALASFAEGGVMPRGWAGVVGPTHPFVGVVDGGLTLNKTS
ncbi:hypothetical protein FOA52_009433 [Chlamydomonas sp. UWO 241]|nr:hypothetical protein FOA52_009433 [Chlamydomonas sp. UWO 241]